MWHTLPLPSALEIEIKGVTLLSLLAHNFDCKGTNNYEISPSCHNFFGDLYAIEKIPTTI
jgi:hypothetical protein